MKVRNTPNETTLTAIEAARKNTNLESIEDLEDFLDRL